jgi:hypothetical protein
MQAKKLKWDAKALGLIGAMSSLTYTLASGVDPNSSLFFDLSRIPVWAVIAGLLVCVASIALSVHLCKGVDRKTAEKKKIFEDAFEHYMASHGDLSNQ